MSITATDLGISQAAADLIAFAVGKGAGAEIEESDLLSFQILYSEGRQDVHLFVSNQQLAREANQAAGRYLLELERTREDTGTAGEPGVGLAIAAADLSTYQNQPLTSTPPNPRLSLTVADALQWFEEIPGTTRGITVSYGSEKFIVLSSATQRGADRTIKLLTVRDGRFVGLSLGTGDQVPEPETVLNSFLMVHFVDVLAESPESSLPKPGSELLPDAKLMATAFRGYFESLPDGEAPWIVVPPEHLRFDSLHLSYQPDGAEAAYVHPNRYLTPGIGTRQYAEVEGLPYAPIQTPVEWYNNLTPESPNVIMIDGRRVYIVIANNAETGAVDHLLFYSEAPKNSNRVQLSHSAGDEVFSREHGMVLGDVAAAIHASLTTREPLRPRVARIIQKIIDTPNKAQFGDEAALPKRHKDVTSTHIINNGQGTLINLKPGDSDFPFTVIDYLPFLEGYQRRGSFADLKPLDWFRGLSEDLPFVDVVAGRRIAYLVDPYHPLDRGLIAFESETPSGEPRLSVHGFSTRSPSAIELAEDLFQYFQSGKQGELHPLSIAQIEKMFSSNNNSAFPEDLAVIQSNDLSAQSVVGFYTDHILKIARSPYSGMTEVSWLVPYSPEAVVGARPTIEFEMPGTDTEMIERGRLTSAGTAPITDPLAWYRSFSADDPNVIPVTVDGETVNLLVLGGVTKPDSLTIVGESRGRLGIWPTVARPEFSRAIGMNARHFTRGLFEYVKGGKTGRLDPRIRGALKKLIKNEGIALFLEEGETTRKSLVDGNETIVSFSGARIGIHIEMKHIQHEVPTMYSAPLSELIDIQVAPPPPPGPPPKIREVTLTRVDRPFTEDPGFIDIQLYEDQRAGYGVAHFTTPLPGEQEPEGAVMVYHLPREGVVNDALSLSTHAVRAVTYPLEEAGWLVDPDRPLAFSEHQEPLQVRSDGNSPPQSLNLFLSRDYPIGYGDNRLRGNHDLFNFGIEGEQYQPVNGRMSSGNNAQITRRSSAITFEINPWPLVIAHPETGQAQEPERISLRVRFLASGEPDPRSVSVRIGFPGEDAIIIPGELMPVEASAFWDTRGQYYLTAMIGRTRLILGADLTNPSDLDPSALFAAYPFIFHDIVNFDDVMARRQRQEDLESINQAVAAVNENTPQPITTNPINISNQNARNRHSRWHRVGSSVVPMAVNFNGSLRALRMRTEVSDNNIQVRFFNNPEVYEYSVTAVERRGAERFISLTPANHTAPPGEFYMVADRNSTSTHFAFPNDPSESESVRQTHNWVNRVAHGPRLSVDFDETSNRVSLSTSYDPFGELAYQLQQIWGPSLSLDLGEGLENRGRALELLEETSAAYSASLAEYRRIARARNEPVLPAREEERVFDLGLTQSAGTVHPAQAIDLELSPVARIGLNLAIEEGDQGARVELTEVQVRGQNLGTDGLRVQLAEEDVTVPLAVSDQTNLSVTRRTETPGGWERLRVSVSRPSGVQLVGERYITRNGTSYEVDVPTSIRTTNGEVPEDVLGLSITVLEHPVDGTMVSHATLTLDEYSQRVSGEQEICVEVIDPAFIEFDIPNIGTVLYSVENPFSEDVTGERDAEALTWQMNSEGGVPRVAARADGINERDFHLFTREVDDVTRYFVSEEDAANFSSWMTLMGHVVPDVAGENRFAEVQWDGTQVNGFVPALVVGDVVGTPFIPLGNDVRLQDATSPPAVVGAAAEADEIDSASIQRVPIRVDENTVLDFAPDELFVTGERTIQFLERSFTEERNAEGEMQTQTSLVRGQAYEYELQSDSGLVLVLPVIWNPEQRKGPFVYDSGRQTRVYRRGHDPSTAVPITDDRFKIRQEPAGDLRIYLLEASLNEGLKSFQIETVRSGLFLGGVNVLNAAGERQEPAEIRGIRDLAKEHNEERVARNIGRPIRPISLASFSDPQVEITEGETRRVALTYFAQGQGQESWVRLGSLEVLSSGDNLQVVGVVQATFGHGQGIDRAEDETVQLVPTPHPESNRELTRLVEVRDGEATGRVFDLNLVSHEFKPVVDELEDLGPPREETAEDFQRRVGDQGVPMYERETVAGEGGPRVYEARSQAVVPVLLDTDIPYVEQEKREALYPSPEQIRPLRAEAADVVGLQNTLSRLHDQGLFPERETTFGQVLTGGDRLTNRFMAPGVIVELPLQLRDNGNYVASAQVDPDEVLEGGRFLIQDAEDPEQFVEVPAKFRSTQVEGATTFEMVAGVGSTQVEMDFEVVRTTSTLSGRPAMALLGVQGTRERRTAPMEVREGLLDWLAFNQLRPDSPFVAVSNDAMVQLGESELEMWVPERIPGQPFEVAGIEHEREGDDPDGTVLRSYAKATTGGETTELGVTRATNDTPMYYLESADGPKIAAVSNQGQTLLFDERPGVSRFISTPQAMRVTALTNELRPFSVPEGSRPKTSAFRIVLQDESPTEIRYRVSILATRGIRSTTAHRLEFDEDSARMGFTLVYDRESETFRVESGRMRTPGAKQKDPMEWQGARVEMIHGYHETRTRIYFGADRKGYAWIELDNLDSLVTEGFQQRTVEGVFSHYMYRNYGRQFHPNEPGFLEILFGMYEVDEIDREMFASALRGETREFNTIDTTGVSLRERLLDSEQRFDPDFRLFAGALEAFGTRQTNVEFPSQFAALVQAVKMLKASPSPVSSSTLPPTVGPGQPPPLVSPSSAEARSLMARRFGSPQRMRMSGSDSRIVVPTRAQTQAVLDPLSIQAAGMPSVMSMNFASMSLVSSGRMLLR